MKKVDGKTNLPECDYIIHVTDYGADPSGLIDSTEAIWNAFEAAKLYQDKGTTQINFSKGIYQLQKCTAKLRNIHTSNTDSIMYPEKRIALLLEDQTDVIINGNGSLFMINGDCMAIALISCKNVYLYNFSFDYVVPTVVEMTVTSIGEDSLGQYTNYIMPDCFRFKIDESAKNLAWYGELNPETNEPYWKDDKHQGAGVAVIYNPRRHIVERCDINNGPFSANKTRIKHLSSNEIRIYYGNSRPDIHKKGMVFEYCSIPDRETAGAFIWESTDVIVEELNIHYLHAFGWLTQMSHNVSFLRCVFKPREKTGRYASSYADLIHVSGASGHIQITGCQFFHSHDDPINIHGTFTRVEKRVDKRTMELRYIHRQQGGFPQFYKGNNVAFYRRDTLRPISSERHDYKVAHVLQPGQAGNDLRTMIVTFDRDLPDELFAKENGESMVVAENMTFTPDVSIQDNYFETVPTRGILCTTGRRVIIEGNTFKNMTMENIFISNDADEWYESGPVKDVTIRDNHFYVPNVSQINQSHPAIGISPITKGLRLPSYKESIHRNIKIIQNTFHMAHDLILSAESVSDLLFKDNFILCDQQNQSIKTFI